MLDFDDYLDDWAVPSMGDLVRVDGLYFCDEGFVVGFLNDDTTIVVRSTVDEGVRYAYPLDDASTEVTILGGAL